MINLEHTSEQMLAAIGASGSDVAERFAGAAEPGTVQLRETRLITATGKKPDDLMPSLDAALAEQFAAVPATQLKADLLSPLKKGIGNAYKRGNLKDSAKSVTVRIVVTPAGAVAAVSDEGAGFDFASVARAQALNETYYTNHGSGFRKYHKTKSLISFTDGGRTLLIRFLREREPGRALDAADRSLFGQAADEEFMRAVLVEKLPCFNRHRAELGACRIYVPKEQETDQLEIRYALDFPLGSSTLSGRVLAESAARTELSVTQQLHERCLNGKDRVDFPRPAVALTEPPLVLFKMLPSKSLREHFKDISDFGAAAQLFEMVGRGLRALHDSDIVLDSGDEPEEAVAPYRAAGKSVLATLRASDRNRAKRARGIVALLAERSPELTTPRPAPIHGDCGWTRIMWDDQRGRFYFHHFEHVRRAHPGHDLGGFLADMLRFYRVGRSREDDFSDAGREVFLKSYFEGDAPPWQEDVSYFVAGAMLLRLERLLRKPKAKWERKVDALLELCEKSLGG